MSPIHALPKLISAPLDATHVSGTYRDVADA